MAGRATVTISAASLVIGTAVLLAVATCGTAERAYTHEQTVTLGGVVWSIPVYDGTNLVVSTESNGVIRATKYDLDLNPVSASVIVATTNDTYMNDRIADHKHIFMGGAHYIAFSISGVASNEGSGGHMYVVKLDRDLNRLDLKTAVSNDPPTNDMILGGDGDNIYVGKFLPGTGHQFYKLDSHLNAITSFPVGGGPGSHGNGAALLYHNDQFELVAPRNLAPGGNHYYFHLSFDTNGNTLTPLTTILAMTNMLSIVSGLSFETNDQRFVVHHTYTSGEGGDIYRLLYDTNWDLIARAPALEGDYSRPHSVIVSNKLYLGYDGATNFVSSFVIGFPSADINPLVYYDFQTPSTNIELTADYATNLVAASAIDTWDSTPDDVSGNPGRAVGNTLWDTNTWDRYFDFTLVVDPDYVMGITELSFGDLSDPGGPTNWSFRIGVDGYSNSWVSGATHTTWFTNVNNVMMPALMGTTTFRIAAGGATNSGATWRIDDLQLTGFMEKSDMADDDGDGIPNGIEEQYSGSTTGLVASADPDGDGMNNMEEFVADLSPVNDEERLEIGMIEETGNALEIYFAIASENRMYRLQRSTNLLSTNWADVQVSPGTNTFMVLTDTNLPPVGIYRINVSF